MYRDSPWINSGPVRSFRKYPDPRETYFTREVEIWKRILAEIRALPEPTNPNHRSH